MHPAIVSGIVTGDAPVSYWLIFFSVPSNSPRRLCEGLPGPISFSFFRRDQVSPFIVALYSKISSFAPVLSLRNVLDSFYLPIFYSEKFST